MGEGACKVALPQVGGGDGELECAEVDLHDQRRRRRAKNLAAAGGDDNKRNARLVLVASEYALWGWAINVIVPCMVLFFLHRSDGDVVEREEVPPSSRLIDWDAAYRGTRFHVLPVLALLLSWTALRLGALCLFFDCCKSSCWRRALLSLDLLFALAIDIVWLQFSYLSWIVWSACFIFTLLPSLTDWEGDIFEACAAADEENNASTATKTNKALLDRKAPWRRRLWRSGSSRMWQL